MNNNIIAGNLRRAKEIFAHAQEGRFITGEEFDRLGRFIEVAWDAVKEQPELIEPENSVEAANLLIKALQPFAAILAPDTYEDSTAVAVEVRVPREVAEKYHDAHNEEVAKGGTPRYARPNLNTGENWPTQVLSVEGINIGEIRFAQRALAAVTKPEEKVLN